REASLRSDQILPRDAQSDADAVALLCELRPVGLNRGKLGTRLPEARAEHVAARRRRRISPAHSRECADRQHTDSDHEQARLESGSPPHEGATLAHRVLLTAPLVLHAASGLCGIFGLNSS